ncbi:MAG: biopolymer transporter ExbD [Balneolaceae bacterium]|jgi:biopolymer transport protein ExbD|nr:MAG: biopolymer transporter ExbD [Balneolaceae bacterium]
MNFRPINEIRKPLSVFSLSSLTDIVLLLLIFFLLTSSFVANFGIRVNVPRADTSAQTQPQYINVTVTKEGDFYVGGEMVSKSLLATAIRTEYQKNPQGTLVLRADKDAIIDNAVFVMNIGKALNMNIMMATERGI